VETETVLHRRYELGELLGEGGMGSVFRAFDTTTRRQVAIKVLRPSGFTASSADIERFRREGEALRILDHPNIVKVFDAFQDGDRHYLVMECVDGGSLEGMLDAQVRMPLGRVVELGLDISDALARAHRLGIVHRDVKPANVLIAADGTACLSDFGVAYIAGRERLSGSTNVVGTLDYLSPETVNGEQVDAGADIWALGVMLFEMLSGRAPFKAEHGGATLHAILRAPPPDLEGLRPDCPTELVDLIYRMLEKNRHQRIPTARQVGAALENILSQVDDPHWPGQHAPQHTIRSARRALVSPCDEPALARTVACSKAASTSAGHQLQATPFLGRETELAALARLLLDPAVQLVTVAGAGGTGKTRLALETMRRFVQGTGAFAATAVGEREAVRSAFLVELAPLARPELLVAAIAEAIGLKFYPGAEPKAQLIGHLSGRRTLLVLDNFEHLLEAAGLVSELMKAAPDTRVFTTSRERLGLSGERVFALSGLAFPETGEAEGLGDYSSVRLFVESARRIDPAFELTDSVAPGVVHVCRLVQGLPLGIVLAASWSNVLSPVEIAEEIGRGFEFLCTELKDVPARQHSLRAVFDYSRGLLREDERAVFERLSVFRGGFTRRSAEQVAGASLKTLAALLNKSLVSRDPGSGRYRIHELLRQYAQGLLRDSSGESQRIEAAHAEHYTQFLRQRSPRFRADQPLVVAREIEDELDNVRAAWARALELRSVDSVSGLLEGLGYFFTFRSTFTEAEQAFGDAVTSFRDPFPEPASERARVLACALCFQAQACAAQWRHAEALPLASEAIALADEQSHPGEAGHPLLVWAVSSLWVGQVEAGLEAGFRALGLFRRAGDHWEVARALLMFGRCRDWLGGTTAEALIRESMELQRLLPKSAVLIGESLMHLGEILSERGNYAEGCRLTFEAMSLAEAEGDAHRKLLCLKQLTAAQRRRGDYDAAENAAREGLALARASFPFAEAWCQVLLADVLKERGQFDEAAFYFRASMADGSPLNVALSTFNLGDLALMRGERADGAAMIADSLAGFERHGTNWGVALASCYLGDLASEEARYCEAQELHQRALSAAREVGLLPHALMIVASIARRKAFTGDAERAVELLALVKRHPITERQTLTRQVEPALADLAVRLHEPTLRAAMQRGAELDLETTLRILSAER
jgi:predicted ATPase